MPLPILSHHPLPTTEDLVRFYHRTALHWARQTADEEAALDVGVALLNRSFGEITEANYLLDASLPDGTSPAAAVDLVDAHFAAAKTRCAKWVMNPSVPSAQTAPLAAHLLASGFQREPIDILHLAGQPGQPIQEVAGLTIIPARASFRHLRQLLAEWIGERPPQMIDLLMLNFEDPQTDALIALQGGVPAALVAVLPVGDIGCIENIFVAAPFRGQGMGRTMMSRALEICARSLFKHVFIACDPLNVAAHALYRSAGFRRIGEYAIYHAAQARREIASPRPAHPLVR